MPLKHYRIFILRLSLLAALIFAGMDAMAARLKDIASIRGVRENQLIGYGIVVGLKGTGDGKNEFTSKSMIRLLDKLGVKLEATDIASKNVAAVIVTATLPTFLLCPLTAVACIRLHTWGR